MPTPTRRHQWDLVRSLDPLSDEKAPRLAPSRPATVLFDQIIADPEARIPAGVDQRHKRPPGDTIGVTHTRQASTRHRGGRPRRQARGSVTRRVGVGASAAALIAAAGIGVATTHHGAADPSLAAAAVLDRAADITVPAFDPSQLQTGWIYTREIRQETLDLAHNRRAVVPVRLITVSRQTFSKRGETEDNHRVRVQPLAGLTTASQRTLVQNTYALRPRVRFRSVHIFSRGEAPEAPLSYPQLTVLPTRPLQLRKALVHLFPGQFPGTLGTFVLVEQILSEPIIPTPARAALYRMVATLPGIRLQRHTRDGIHRQALAVTLSSARFDLPASGPTDVALLFDSRTLQLLGTRAISRRAQTYPSYPSYVPRAERLITQEARLPKGTVVSQTTFLRSDAVNPDAHKLHR